MPARSVESTSAPGSESTDEKPRRQKSGAPAEDNEDRTRLAECEIAPNSVVEAGTEAKGETLRRFMLGVLMGQMRETTMEWVRTIWMNLVISI